MKFNDILEKRHCSRHFKSKAVSWKDLAEILDAARFAPCAGGIFTIRFIIVDDKTLKKNIANACLGQAFVAEAPYVVVILSDMEQVKRSYGSRADFYARQQAGAAVENMFLKSTELGISTCWIGAFDENPIRRELSIPKEMIVEAVMPFGYEMGKEKSKAKLALKHLVRYNSWKTFYKPTWPDSTATSNE